MREAPGTTESPRPHGPPLWRILLLAAMGLFVVWCAPRFKPVLAFGPLFGLMLGGTGLMLDRLIGAGAVKPRAVFAAVCGIAGCAAAFGLTIHTVHRHVQKQPRDALANALIQSLEQAEGTGNPKMVSFNTGWQSTAERYFTQRYRRLPGPAWPWLAMEAIAAGVIAGLFYRLFAQRPVEAVT